VRLVEFASNFFVCGQMGPDRDQPKACGSVQSAWSSYLLSWQSPCTKINPLAIGGNFFLVRGVGVRREIVN
jgi:hypothetical protein